MVLDLTVSGMVKQVKGGYLLRYKKRLFGKAWREEWVVLYEDSTLAWFKEKGRLEPEGSLVVREAPELMAVSQWTARIPGRPDLPPGCQLVQLMAFGTRRREKVHWLLAQNEQEVNDWMTAISNTLPPPPQPPDSGIKSPSKPLDPVTPRLPPPQYYNTTPIPGEVPPPYTTVPPPVYGGGGIVPPAVAPPSNNTTILVRDGGGGYYGRSCGGSGAADFATGMVMGAALSNWGHGWGWGGGWGWAGGGPGVYHGANDIHINNHIDVNNTVVSNGDIGGSVEAATPAGGGGGGFVLHEDYGDLAFDDGDYGMDCGGDFGF